MVLFLETIQQLFDCLVGTVQVVLPVLQRHGLASDLPARNRLEPVVGGLRPRRRGIQLRLKTKHLRNRARFQNVDSIGRVTLHSEASIKRNE